MTAARRRSEREGGLGRRKEMVGSVRKKKGKRERRPVFKCMEMEGVKRATRQCVRQ